MNQYDSLRSLPLPSVAQTLGIDLQRFKNRKDGELYGPCPIHRPKQNQTSFSYASDGRYHCFSCNAKGRGAIDLTMAVLSVSFQSAKEGHPNGDRAQRPRRSGGSAARSGRGNH